MRINVCLASDENYVQHLTVVIASILKNANISDELYFYILSNKISESSKTKILQVKDIKECSMIFIELDVVHFEKCPVFNNHITITMYYRYMIASVCPDIDKIIYLDCDVVVEDSLAELFNTNIDDYWIGAVEDVGYTFHRQFDERMYKFFYVNSGVLLINLKKWREDNIEKLLFDTTIEMHDKILQGDQDIINLALREKCLTLDYKWNVQDTFFRKNAEVRKNTNKKLILKAAKNPSIIHFTGAKKPWQELIIPKATSYLKYLQYTPWKGSLPTDVEYKKYLWRSLWEYICKYPFFLLNINFWKSNRFARKKTILAKEAF